MNNKILLITGGTGSFGTAVVDKYLNTDIKEIRIFSRDEKKQDDLRRKYKSNKLVFIIGDVRDYSSIYSALFNVDYVFHAAALKQVPSCEFFPMEAVKTNVYGTSNVLDAAIARGVKSVVCLSTDKAAYPVNAMGISKAMMEKVAIAKARTTNTTTISVTRYGNVLASRGSVVPLFQELIAKGLPLTITNPEMTRFIMTLEEAVELVEFAFHNAKSGDLFIQKAKSATIGQLARVIKQLYNYNVSDKIIGTRHGEKLYETLMTVEEKSAAIEIENFFRIPSDDRDLNYSMFESKGTENALEEDYHSHNVGLISDNELKELLIKVAL